MYAEQVTTRRASNVSHHSTEWIVRFTGPGSQPWCRPASVAWMVATSGTPEVVARAWSPACATSQSWACTTSNERPAQAASAARVSAWLNAIVQASRSSVEAEPGRVLGRPDHPHPAGDLVERDARACPGAGSPR